MSSNSGLADIVALANLISSAVQDVVAEYSSAGVSLPSLSSTVPGPFDTPESMPANLSRAIRIIEAACTQLSYAVASPGHVVLNKSYGYQEPACMLVATDFKIADHLLDKPEGLPVEELSRKAGFPDPDKLSRCLRLLATKHCFTEVKPNVWANNRVSIKLVSTEPVAGSVGHMSDEIGLACTALSQSLKQTDPFGASAFELAHKCNVFDLYARPEEKKRADRFAQAMVGWGEVTGKGMLPKVYPWASLPNDTVLCDVGGSNGHASINLLKAFPHLQVIVQDLPGVVEQGKEFVKTEISDPALRARVQYVDLDFFQEVPVKDCDIYYVRHVLHDWDNDECKKILDNIRKAVKPTSRVFIHELVLQHVVSDGISDSQFDKAPEPLLANFGAGRFRLYGQDINMMVIHNSQERTLPQFIDIGARSGFKFVKLWDGGEVGLLEFVPMSV